MREGPQMELFVLDGAKPKRANPTPAEAKIKRDAAIKQADENAKERWKQIAEQTVLAVAAEKETFSADDVWERLSAIAHGDKTHDPRALGAIMKRLAGQRLIKTTGSFVRSTRRHMTPIVEWTRGEVPVMQEAA